MKQEIQKLIEKALNYLGYEIGEVEVDYPKVETFGDYTTNVAMVLAKVAKKNPMEVAESIKNKVESIKQNEIEKIEIVKPGYINFHLSKEYLQDKVREINEKENKFGNGEFHIGHLRNVFIGNSLVNVLRKSNGDVIAANYIGDTGTHIAKCLWGIVKFNADENLDNIENKAEFLGKVYSEAVKAIEETAAEPSNSRRLMFFLGFILQSMPPH